MKSRKRQGLTTGEVARMLGGAISQRTVIRYFDTGIFTGWRRSVTGRRFIDPESINPLAKRMG